jgi:hypothetical protein
VHAVRLLRFAHTVIFVFDLITDLTNANLTLADLSDADLFNADLTNADLSNANLRFADLGGADLTNAILANAVGLGSSTGAALYDINTDFTNAWADGTFFKCARYNPLRSRTRRLDAGSRTRHGASYGSWTRRAGGSAALAGSSAGWSDSDSVLIVC